MKRRKHSNYNNLNTHISSIRQRDYTTIATPVLTPSYSFASVEDNRSDFIKFKPRRTVFGTTSPVKIKPSFSTLFPTRFKLPVHAIVCVRRKIRRQVLFAKNRTGKGSHSKKHYNLRSAYSC